MGGHPHLAELQLPPGCSTMGRTCVQDRRTNHGDLGTAGGLGDLRGEMRMSGRKQGDQFGSTNEVQGSLKPRRGAGETWDFQEQDGRGRCGVLLVLPTPSRPKGGGIGCKIQKRAMRKRRNPDLSRLWSVRIPPPSSQQCSLLPGTGTAQAGS